MKPLPLDDLPTYSEWAAYLLDPAGEPPDDPERYAGTDYYEATGERLLDAYREDPVGPDELHRNGRAHGRSDPDAISIDADLYLATTDEVVERERATVRDGLAPVLDGDEVSANPGTVVDLGCGWGATLGWIADAFPDVAVIGGEYSRPSVEVGRDAFADRDRIELHRFDVRGDRTPLDAAVGDDCDGPEGGSADDVVAFTRGSVTTMDDVAGIVDHLAARATDGDVAAGVHLEQVDAHPDTVLGHLRRHYGRVRGYSDSLLGELEAHPDVAVTAVEYDVLGVNPLHPHTLVRWRPA